MKSKFRNSIHGQQGFSLIEVLVSLSIFAIVVTISVSVLMVLIDANARAENTQEVMTNVSFALDSMTREMRTGTDFFCGDPEDLPVDGETTQNCESGGTAFSFNEGGQSLTENTPNDSRRISFRLNGTTIERRLGNGDGDSNVNETDDWQPITSDDVGVNKLLFVTSGATRRDDESPTVTIDIEGTAGDDDSQGIFQIQTSVVQQLIDI